MSRFPSLTLSLSLALCACAGSDAAFDAGGDPGGDAAIEVAGEDDGAGDPGPVDDGVQADEGVPADPGAVDEGTPADPGGIDLPPDATGPVTVTVPIGAATDAVASYLIDAALGEWNLFGGADVPIGRHWDGAHVSYHTALRFPGVPVPAGATIASARLSFQPIGPYVGTKESLWIDLRAERAADSAPFSLSDYGSGRPDQRPKTGAKVPAGDDHWLVKCVEPCPDWRSDCDLRQVDCWDRGVRVTCPKDLAPLVQEVVDLPGWNAGNAITVFLLNAATEQDGDRYQDHRSFTGYDPDRGLEFRPTLEITFE